MSYLGNPRIAMTRQDRMPVANYEVAGNPTTSINPSFTPCSWLNIISGEIFVCTDNTPDSNVWKSSLKTVSSAFPTDAIYGPTKKLTNDIYRYENHWNGDTCRNLRDNFDIGASDSFSVSLWCFMPSQLRGDWGDAVYVFNKGQNTSSAIGHSMLFDPGNDGASLVFAHRISDGTDRAGASFGNLSYDVWHHFVSIIDRTNNIVDIHHNGSNSGKTAGGFGPSTDVLTAIGSAENASNFYLGANNTGSSGYLVGSTAALRFFDRALTAPEIAELFSEFTP